MARDSGDAWPALRARWWAGWCTFFPEDATSLGVDACASRLRGAEGPVGDAERAFHVSALGELDAVDVSSLGRDERLEHEAMRRASAFRAHVIDACDHDRTCFEVTLHVQGMIGHHAAHARTDGDVAAVRARLDAVPRVLAGREVAMREGVARGWAPDRDVVRVVAGYALPGAARWYAGLPASLASRGLVTDDAFAEACRAAAAATESHRAFVERDLAPRSESGAARLGEAEYTARLALTYDEPIDPRRLRAEARETIALLSARLVVSAAHAARGRDLRVRDLRDARAYVGKLFGETLPADADPRVVYGDLIARATAFAVERHLFSAPPKPPAFVPIPDGMIHGGAITNWPAPLLDRTRDGHVAIALEPSAHAAAFTTGLAIHEATPGHFYQSAIWQAHADPAREPVRFVCVHDDVAGATGFFGAMPSIEGFAVHAEDVMFDAGFYDRDAEVASLASGIIRAARTSVDVSLHLGERTVDQATDELADATGMPRGWCASQVVRFLRIPVQATTYFVGERRQNAMLDDARVRLGAAFRADAFHDALIALGPASLRTLETQLRQ
jgi:uncharacterized protein (DUF885 family)